MNKTILVPVVTGVLSLVIGVFGGVTYQKTKQQNLRQNISGQFGTRSGSINGMGTSANRDALLKGNAPVSGKIIKIDDSSITLQTQDGSNKIILISDQTKVNKTTEATKNDLAVGSEIMVIGATTNGAVTAQSISLGSINQRSEAAPTSTSTAK
jgi:ribosomal protein S1